MPLVVHSLAFRDPVWAAATVSALSPDLPEQESERLHQLLTTAADPDAVLLGLEQLHRSQPEAFARLTALPAALPLMGAIFSHSRFLTDELIQHPHWLEDLLASGELDRGFGTLEFRARLADWLGPEPHQEPPPLRLAEFRRRHLLRILLRDVLGRCDVAETTAEISHLADALLQEVYSRLRAALVQRFGEPLVQGPDGQPRPCDFSVLALGKLGGVELNYSSDIDLIFLYAGSGETGGPQPLSNKEFFRRLANRYTELLSTYTREGLCYRVDLRLRPDGKLGEICLSLEGMQQYYATRARDWELQMLIKARVAAGEEGPGAAFLRFIEPRIYQSSLDFSAVEAVSETRTRIHEKLAGRRRAEAERDVKLAPGGIRDIEFLVQCLQRLHGGREPWVRHGGTLLALGRLRDKTFLSPTEYSLLAAAYRFLRTLEHRLQMVADRQTHQLPNAGPEWELLARRMPPEQPGDAPTTDDLERQLRHHRSHVQAIYERVIHAQQPLYYGHAAVPPPAGEPPAPVSHRESTSSNAVRHLDETAPGLAAALASWQSPRGRQFFDQLLDRLTPGSELLRLLEREPGLTQRLFDLFEHGPYLAEQLIRSPELLWQFTYPVGGPLDLEAIEIEESPASLRRSFQRQMFRIQSDSLCNGISVFRTLERTSDLADAAIQAAYRFALEQTRRKDPPLDAAYEPTDQLMAIALGRLGMREFDLASDADLIFVLPDSESREQLFWTRVAGRLVDLLTAYTGEGSLIAVDTRLRPNGRAGSLVQLESTYRHYFATQAEAWEGIAYMKARAVGGQSARATQFLHELQEVDWRRYGQNGRSRKELRQMRLRLEREQSAGHELKTGTGGYYDIDFSLMYLRLKAAGMFFTVLNTPARIDVIERMGHLDRSDAEFLRNAATFYRAVDHGLRVTSGYAEGSLPQGAASRENLTALVRRWVPEHHRLRPLAEQLAEIQKSTRQFFDRLFQ